MVICLPLATISLKMVLNRNITFQILTALRNSEIEASQGMKILGATAKSLHINWLPWLPVSIKLSTT